MIVFDVAPVRHDVVVNGARKSFTSYEVGVLMRAARGMPIPPGFRRAHRLLQREQGAGFEPKMIAALLREAGAPEDTLDFMDDAAIRDSEELCAMTEAIVLEHLDRWREQDKPLDEP